MSNYQLLICLLKVTACNLRTLHRNLVGGNWFGDHENLGDYYEKIDDIEDDVVEIGMSIGEAEPTIAEACSQVEVVTSEKRDSVTSYAMARDWFNQVADTLAAVAAELNLGYITSKFEEYEYDLRKEANFKLSATIGAEEPTQTQQAPAQAQGQGPRPALAKVLENVNKLKG